MKKFSLKERFQQLAGIKPLYENLNEIGDEKLSPESSEWLKDQINMYFDGGDELEPGGRGEFEITRMEQGDPKKYQDAQSAQKFLDELKVIKSVVVRFDDYIGDILVLSDREGDAMVSWTNPGDNQVVPEDYSKGNELEVEQSRTDQLLKQADILTDDERDYAFDVLSKMHKKLNPTLDVEKTRIIIDFAEAVLQEFYE